jgi:hypothetical protein
MERGNSIWTREYDLINPRRIALAYAVMCLGGSWNVPERSDPKREKIKYRFPILEESKLVEREAA